MASYLLLLVTADFKLSGTITWGTYNPQNGSYRNAKRIVQKKSLGAPLRALTIFRHSSLCPIIQSVCKSYATTVLPARAYKPRDKSLVEGSVKLIYRSIYIKLEERIFHDLESLNAALRVALEIHKIIRLFPSGNMAAGSSLKISNVPPWANSTRSVTNSSSRLS
jgi:hypothetical protein